MRMPASFDHPMGFHDDFSFDTTVQDNLTEENILSKPICRSSDIPPVPSKVFVRADDCPLYESNSYE